MILDVQEQEQVSYHGSNAMKFRAGSGTWEILQIPFGQSCKGLRHSCGQLGMSLNTARTHTRSIYGKAGIDRQATLVRAIQRSAAALS